MTTSGIKQLSRTSIDTLSAINRYRHQRRLSSVGWSATSVLPPPPLLVLRETPTSARSLSTARPILSLPTKGSAWSQLARSNQSIVEPSSLGGDA